MNAVGLHWFTVFGAQYVFIGLRALQQRNVAFDNYTAVIPTSVAMASVEVLVISSIARTGWEFSLVSALALGGGFGSLTAMWIHRKCSGLSWKNFVPNFLMRKG